MTDYINREDAIKALEKWHLSGVLLLAPVLSADVRENVRGEWVFPYEDKKYKRCSVCRKTFYSIPATSNFCPNCGAEMRGDNNVQRNDS